MIAIKGMGMPRHCLECRFSQGGNPLPICWIKAHEGWAIPHVKERALKNNRPSWCPLVEIKEVGE